jgi:hypothetical protein
MYAERAVMPDDGGDMALGKSQYSPDHEFCLPAEKRNYREQVRVIRDGHPAPASGQSAASFSSRIRMQFHRAGIFDSGGHCYRRAAN